MGMIVLLMKFHGSGIDPIPIWKDGCSQKKLKDKNELCFLFVDTLLHTITSYCFDKSYRILMDYSFLNLKVYIYYWYNLEILEYYSISYIYHNFLSFTISK